MKKILLLLLCVLASKASAMEGLGSPCQPDGSDAPKTNELSSDQIVLVLQAIDRGEKEEKLDQSPKGTKRKSPPSMRGRKKKNRKKHSRPELNFKVNSWFLQGAPELHELGSDEEYDLLGSGYVQEQDDSQERDPEGSQQEQADDELVPKLPSWHLMRRMEELRGEFLRKFGN